MPKIARVDKEVATASDASDDPFRGPTRASFYHDSNDEGHATSTMVRRDVGTNAQLRFDHDTSSDDDIELVGEVASRQQPQAASPPPSRVSAHNGHQSLIASSPTRDEKRFLDVCITVKFDDDEGDIDGVISVLQGTTIASLLSKTLAEYHDAFTQNWPYVIMSKWNEKFRRAFPIPASEYAHKRCEDGARYEAFFFVEAATRHHRRFWYPAKVIAVQLKAERQKHPRRRTRRAANPSSMPQSQEMKREEDDAGSNVAESRRGPSGNTPSRQEQVNATVPDAQDVEVKQEHEAAIDHDNIDRLAEDIVREAAKLEQAHSPRSEELDRAPSAIAATVVEAATNSVPGHDNGIAQPPTNGLAQPPTSLQQSGQGAAVNDIRANATPVKTRRTRACGTRKSKTTADEQQQENEASEATDAGQQSVDAIQKPEKPRRRRSRRVVRKSTAIIPAKRAKDVQATTQKVPQAIFRNRKFALTSATRVNRAAQPQFNKREFRSLIEQRGGTVIDEFKGLGDDDETYLIADTHYRTHKYLSALSLSVLCVHHTWIMECIEQDTFVDFKEYMLASGQALGPDGTIHEYQWKPHKGRLLAGKKVWIHSKKYFDPAVVAFVQLWSPIVSAVGAKVVRDDEVPRNERELLQWIAAGMRY